MVEHDLVPRGVSDPRVIDAMGGVPRERFVPTHLVPYAYDDTPLPIGSGQTISQPLIVATMAEAAELTPGCRVLEVGAGSGYGAAVLGELVDEVWTVERHESLVKPAADRIRELGYDNVHVVVGDGSRGLPEHAPYDAIVVTAGATEIPPALCGQLAVGGRLVIPVGLDGEHQRLLRVRRLEDEFVEEDLGGVRFVPLVRGVRPAKRVRGGRPRFTRSSGVTRAG